MATMAPVPDGGCLAWTIVAASFMVSFLQDGFTYSYGVLIPSISEHFNTGRSEAALSNSILTLMTLGSGPMVAFLIKTFGHRIVTNVGVLLSVVGMVMAGLCIEFMDKPDIITIYVSIGLLTGIGFGLMYLPAMDIIELYFDKNLGLAFGIGAAGSGLGQLAVSPLIPLVEKHLGLAYTLYLLGGCMSIGFLFGSMYVPPKEVKDQDCCPQLCCCKSWCPSLSFKSKWKRDPDSTVNIRVRSIKDPSQRRQQSLLNQEDKTDYGSTMEEEKDSHSRDDIPCESAKSQTSKSKLVKKLAVMLHPYKEVFTTPPMILHHVYILLINCTIFAGFSFTMDRALVMVPNLGKQEASYLLSIMGATNCVGRILFGWVLDIGKRHAILISFLICLTLSASMIASNLVADDLWAGHAAFSGVFGLMFGGYISSLVIVLKEIDSENITTSLGVLLFNAALGSIIGPQIVGKIYDSASLKSTINPIVQLEAKQGAYATGFYIMGGIGLAGGVFLLSTKMLILKSKKINGSVL